MRKNDIILSWNKIERKIDRMDQRDKIMVTTEELQYMLSCGRRNAEKIGFLAKAEVEIGNYSRWNLEKVREFLYKESM